MRLAELTHKVRTIGMSICVFALGEQGEDIYSAIVEWSKSEDLPGWRVMS